MTQSESRCEVCAYHVVVDLGLCASCLCDYYFIEELIKRRQLEDKKEGDNG